MKLQGGGMNYKKKAMLYRLYKLDKPWALTGKKIADFYRSLLLIGKE